MKQDSKDTYRYEIKFVLPENLEGNVLGWIFAHSNGFRVAYPDRWVNNIYFDTYHWAFRNDHINGVYRRSKLRFRWYGDTDDIRAGQLELKTREGRLGEKLVEPVQLEIPLGKLSWKDISSSLAARTTELKSLVLLTHPVMINRYLRSYFISADQKIRITLDRNQISYDQSLSQRPNLSRSNPRVEELIVEIKAGSSQTQRLTNVIAEFPFYAAQYSKYLIATNYSV